MVSIHKRFPGKPPKHTREQTIVELKELKDVCIGEKDCVIYQVVIHSCYSRSKNPFLLHHEL